MPVRFPDAFAGRLLTWYGRNRRRLPWREDPSPYRTWISEVMLQQTRVETGVPYFERFVRVLPDIPSLAAAPEETLLKLWQGLGYYSRARNLGKAAVILMRDHGGRLPRDYAALLALPGFGEYTAGAVASIAFDLPVPAVDGNVLRVTARLLGDRRDIGKAATKAAFRGIVAASLPSGRAGDFNQALMELGALLCLPSGAPLCGRCPVREFCRASAEGTAGVLPAGRKTVRRRTERKTVLLLLSGGRVLLRRRPGSGLLAGLWEFPSLEGWIPPGEAASVLGLDPASARALPPAGHSFSHLTWLMRGALLEAPAGVSPPPGFRFCSRRELDEELPLPSAFSVYRAVLLSLPPSRFH